MNRKYTLGCFPSMIALCAAVTMAAEGGDGGGGGGGPAAKKGGLKITKPPGDKPARAPRIAAVVQGDPNAPPPVGDNLGGPDPEPQLRLQAEHTEHRRRDPEPEPGARRMPPSAAKVVYVEPEEEGIDKTKPYFLDELGRRGRVITLVIPAPVGDDGTALPNTSTSTHEEVLPHGAPDVADPEHRDPQHPLHGKDAASAKKRLATRWMVG